MLRLSTAGHDSIFYGLIISDLATCIIILWYFMYTLVRTRAFNFVFLLFLFFFYNSQIPSIALFDGIVP